MNGMYVCLLLFLTVYLPGTSSQSMRRRLGRFEEVFAWKQLTFNIDGQILTRDRDEPVGRSRGKRQLDDFDGDDNGASWNIVPPPPPGGANVNSIPTDARPNPVSVSDTSSDENRFFIQYNNVPMGMERVGDRLFVTIPRRRYGIPSTLNYIYLNSTDRSPPLRPYPDIRQAADVTSVYRTRADECGRLWAVDTGRLELPGVQRQIRNPGIIIYDLNTNRQILRYDFRREDVPAENTPTGLASITVDITDGNCADAYAYVTDLTTYGLIVYSLRENTSWRHTHNYYSFNPLASILNVADQRFTWNDGIFSLALLPGAGGCKTALFHSLIGMHEFSVSTCILKNRTAINDPNYFLQYNVVGDKGEMSQCTVHGYHPGSNVVFFAEVNRDAVTCWNAGEVLRSTNVGVLERHKDRLSYPSDLHVTGDELWVMANTLPRFGYSRLNTNDYNFYIYRAQIPAVIAGTVCERNLVG